MEQTCTKCKTLKPLTEFYSRSDRSYSHSYCKYCFNSQVVERQRELKQQAIQYKGGSCKECGYNKCQAALQFHHRDPQQKDFQLGSKSNKRITDKIKQELDKCDLLCANCHAEIHYKGHKH